MAQKPNGIEVDLVPLKLFSQRISEGWAMVPGYPLQPGDYAVAMMPPDFPKPRSNASRAAAHRASLSSERRSAAATRAMPGTTGAFEGAM
jgi:hypothetical protein